jgi:hypothetical protein
MAARALLVAWRLRFGEIEEEALDGLDAAG